MPERENYRMNFVEYARRIRSIGREINQESQQTTREMLSPLAEPLLEPALVRVERDVKYGVDERCRMDIFTPASGFETSRPVLIFLHGGGFITGDKHMEGSPFFSNIGHWAVRNGCNCITMTYRLAPRHQWPSGIIDIHQLVRFIRHEGNDHGLDLDRLFLMGHSAGAAHAASYVAHPDLYAPFSHGLSGLILLSGLYNYTSMPISEKLSSYIGDDFTLYAARSSLAGLLRSNIPMLVTLSEYDPPVFEQQGLELLSAYQRKHQHMPHFVYAAGQNHFSVAQFLGLEGDLLGPQLKAFIDEYSRYR
jgi:acetyl esterase/lipase